MDQAVLNKANLTEWEYDNKYEKLFQLALTNKHALSIGRWESDGHLGVDLRRWSYDKSRNLGEGISLFENVWLSVFEKIIELNKKELFSKYSRRNDSKYEHEFKIDNVFKVTTGTYVPPGIRNQYFCINMIKNGQVAYKGRYAPIRIMIRFNTIPDFIINCQEHNLVPKEIIECETGTDGKTGRQFF